MTLWYKMIILSNKPVAKLKKKKKNIGAIKHMIIYFVEILC